MPEVTIGEFSNSFKHQPKRNPSSMCCKVRNSVSRPIEPSKSSISNLATSFDIMLIIFPVVISDTPAKFNRKSFLYSSVLIYYLVETSYSLYSKGAAHTAPGSVVFNVIDLFQADRGFAAPHRRLSSFLQAEAP